MHQKKFGKPEGIGKERSNSVSSDSNLFSSQIDQFQSQAQNPISQTIPQSRKPHLTIQIPPTSPNPPSTQTQHHHHYQQLRLQQTHFPNHEFFSNSSSPTHALLSTAHKRMTQTLAQSPTLAALKNPRQFVDKNSDFAGNFPASEALSRFIGFAPRFDAERLGVKLARHFNRARVVCFHLRFLVLLLFLPSLYFFVSNPSRFFLLNFLFVLAFSITLLVSLNLALPRFPSIRLFLARWLPNSFSSFSSRPKTSKRVVWSIGSKQKSEKRANSGSWVQAYGNGDVYEGEFHRGKSSGSGVYVYHMKGRYEGDWIDGKYDGYGVETWAMGSRYRGRYRQGMRHGIGVYRFYTGDVYAGEWSNGQCHGCGVHTCDDGSRYVGEFKWGVKHGLGRYHFRNGDVYAGEYFADKMHGFGVYQFGNGHRYEGAWHEGKRQGLGRYTFRNGETQSGHWQNGILNVQCTENTDLQSPFALTVAKVLNTVQEANRAAEKAYDLVKIDDRVNKAVAAANKAANAARVAAIKAVQKQSYPNTNDDLPNTIV